MRRPIVRQKPKHRGWVVYSTETPDAPRQPTPSVSVANKQEEPTKEEPMGRGPLPYGYITDNIRNTIREQLATIISDNGFAGNEVVTTQWVYDNLPDPVKIRLVGAYKTKTGARERVAGALSKMVHYKELIRVPHRNHAYHVTKQGAEKMKMRFISMPDEEVTEPVEAKHEHPHTDEHEHEQPNGNQLVHIGTSIKGEPLYLDTGTGMVGFLSFTPVGRGQA